MERIQIMEKTWSVQTRYFTLGVLMILSAVFLYYVRELIGPLVISALLAYVLDPIAASLVKYTPLKRKLAVGIVFVLFLFTLAVIPASITPVVINQIDFLELEMQEIERGVLEFFTNPNLEGVPVLEDWMHNLESAIGEAIRPEQIFRSIQTATENVVWLLVIMVTTYYILLDWEKLRDWFYRFVPVGYLDDAKILTQKLSDIWRTYLRGQLLSMFLIGMISWIAAAAIGLPGALIIGLVATALAVVPSVGSSLMIAGGGLVAVFSESSVLSLSQGWFILTAVLVFLGVHMLDIYLIRPRILGRGLRLHPALILVAVIGALTLEGALLALIIVPIISSLEVFGSYLMRGINGLPPLEEDDLGDRGD